jgi:hypothetical protein
MIINGIGLDAEAMSQLTEKEFISLHLPNDAIGRGLSEKDRTALLKDTYKTLFKALGKKPEKDKEVKDGL